MKHFYQNIQGWFFAEDVYSEAVRRASDGAHFVEIGSWKGKSTSFMAVEIANSGKKIIFDCVDTWKGSADPQEKQSDDKDVVEGKLFEVFKKNISPAASFVNPIVMDSAAAAMLYKDASLDFIYIDGAHDYESVKKDIAAWLPKLKPGGMITGDDFVAGWPGVVRAVQESFREEEVTIANPTWVVDRGRVERPLTLDVIVRTHSASDVHEGKRVVDVSKTELVIRCLRSVVASLNLFSGEARLFVFDDHSTPECVAGIEKVLQKSHHPSKLIALSESGNAASLKACFEFARDHGGDIIYFIEDDYLQFPEAISEMVETFMEFKRNVGNKEIGLFPVDYPDRYEKNAVYESRVVLGKHRHWRTVQHSTATFMMSRIGIFSYWRGIEMMWQSDSQHISEDETINQVWRNATVLFSPIPSLALHLQFKEQMPPFTDWQALWDSTKLN